MYVMTHTAPRKAKELLLTYLTKVCGHLKMAALNTLHRGYQSRVSIEGIDRGYRSRVSIDTRRRILKIHMILVSSFLENNFMLTEVT